MDSLIIRVMRPGWCKRNKLLFQSYGITLYVLSDITFSIEYILNNITLFSRKKHKVYFFNYSLEISFRNNLKVLIVPLILLLFLEKWTYLKLKIAIKGFIPALVIRHRLLILPSSEASGLTVRQWELWGKDFIGLSCTSISSWFKHSLWSDAVMESFSDSLTHVGRRDAQETQRSQWSEPLISILRLKHIPINQKTIYCLLR